MWSVSVSTIASTAEGRVTADYKYGDTNNHSTGEQVSGKHERTTTEASASMGVGPVGVQVMHECHCTGCWQAAVGVVHG